MVGVILLWRRQILTGVDAQYLASRNEWVSSAAA
jgi:hypothetical protein